jgi:hypothetical protein
MIRSRSRLRSCWILLALLIGGTASAQGTHANDGREALSRLEEAYADVNDAYGAVSLIDSDPLSYPNGSYAGKSRDAWQQLYARKRAESMDGLPKVPRRDLSAADVRALRLMRDVVADSSPTPRSLAPVGRCKDAQRRELSLRPLQQAVRVFR